MFVLIAVIAVVVITIGLVLTDYLETGFEGRTLWDWIELVVPVVVVIIAGWFGWFASRASGRNEVQRERDADRAREATLRTYLEVMSNLIIEKKLNNSVKDSPERAVAHAQTFMALRTLDGPRKLVLLQFLKEAGLIDRDRNVISLYGSNLDKANLSNVDLSGTCLSGVSLKEADLFNANLSNADLSNAILIGAILEKTDLSNANLHNVDLTDSLVKKEKERIWKRLELCCLKLWRRIQKRKKANIL